MIKITDTTSQDVEQIKEWVAADPWHRDDPDWAKAEGMLTGNGLLSFCVQDDKGPLVYVQLMEDEKYVRIAMQFAPEEVVSKRRLIVGLTKGGIPAMKIFALKRGYKGLVFESVNPSLIGFGLRQGFTNVVGTNDFLMSFEG